MPESPVKTVDFGQKFRKILKQRLRWRKKYVILFSGVFRNSKWVGNTRHSAKFKENIYEFYLQGPEGSVK